MGNAIKISISLDYERSSVPNDHSLADGTTWALQAGQPLTGTVHFQVKKRVKQGGRLKLFISGKEKMSRKQKDKVATTNERNLLQVVANLSDMTSQIVERGKYSFPFSIDMGASLPSSMSWGTNKNGCRIQYKISAGMGNFTAERYFTVASMPLPDTKVPCFIEPRIVTIKSMGLLKVPGSIAFGASVDDTHVGRNQKIDISVACINNSTIDIRSVDIKLVELITFSSLQTSFHQKLNILDMKKVEMPGLVTAKTTRASITQNEHSPDASLMSSNHQIYEALTSGENILRIAIPGQARDTYAGGIIKVQHYLKIKMITGLFVDNPFTKIPIHIGNSAARPSCPEQLATPVHPAMSEQPSQLPTQPLPSAPMLVPTISDNDHIAIVAALPIPTAAPLMMEPTIIEAHAIILGGRAVQREHDEPDIGVYDISEDINFDNVVPLVAPAPSAPSFNRLIQDMIASVNDYKMISQRLTLQEWKGIFENLQPTDYGIVVAHISNDFDQPRIAVMVAESIRRFTCSHCIAALRRTADWNRTTVVLKLVPLCVDLQNERGRVLSELSPWEQTITANDFEQALRR